MDFITTLIETAKIYYTTGVRWAFIILAFYILLRQIKSLVQARNPSEIWAYLGCPDGSSVPLTHWENLIGRGKGCDVVINLGSVSRSHGTIIRDTDGIWKYNDLLSKNGSMVNGEVVQGPTEIGAGDILTIAGADFTLYPVSHQERMANIAKRKRRTVNVSPWPSLFALTIFQLLTIIQFSISLGDDFPTGLIPAYTLLSGVMWAYVIVMRRFKRVGFEMEIIAFFLSTLSLAVTTSAYPSTVFKQSICVVLGVILFLVLCWLLRDLGRTKKIATILMGVAVILLIINLTLGQLKYGATNWVKIGGFTFQPSEMVKIAFIYIGAASLDELQQRKNMMVFLIFSVFCLGCLAIMGDFGTAIIFYVTFLVISFLRSGDFTRLLLVIGASALMGMMIIRFKPYIANRFAAWGHVWDDPTGSGYQQVQAMCASASGGIPGLGAGNGALSSVGASPTDLVFCLVSEEWGLIIAILMIVCIVTLGVFAVRSIIAGRSTYYSIAACGAMSMFVFQTTLNVFGTVDLFPLTGVTFPFVSAGGTSMIASWGMLAFLKAADTRQNASFAISLDKKDSRNTMDNYGMQDDILNEIGMGGGAASAAARQAAAVNRARAQKNPESVPKASEYSYDSKKATLVQPSMNKIKGRGHFDNKGASNYQRQSDDEFFKNFEDGRPENSGDSFESRYERVAPKTSRKDLERQTRQKAEAQKRAKLEQQKRAQLEQQKRAQLEQQKRAKLEQQKRAQLEQQKRAKLEQQKRAQLERQKRAKLEQQKRAQLEKQKQEKLEQQRRIQLEKQRRAQAERIRRQKQYEAQQRAKGQQPKREEEQPLTLEDLFGDDYKK